MSAELTRVLKEEISRLARKEINANTNATKKTVAQLRRDVAELKRANRDLHRVVSMLERQEKRRLAGPVSKDLAEGARFSPTWLKKHRARIGFSAAQYAQLVGVHPITIYNWERGKSKPRKEQLAALVDVRQLRKREAKMRLEMIGHAG